MKSVYRKDRYSACPTLRYFGWWYVIVLFMDNSPSTEATGCLSSHVARAGDFLTWHEPTQSIRRGRRPAEHQHITGLPNGGDLTGPDNQIIPSNELDQANSS